jgi:hypothetical protein
LQNRYNYPRYLFVQVAIANVLLDIASDMKAQIRLAQSPKEVSLSHSGEIWRRPILVLLWSE